MINHGRRLGLGGFSNYTFLLRTPECLHLSFEVTLGFCFGIWSWEANECLEKMHVRLLLVQRGNGG